MGGAAGWISSIVGAVIATALIDLLMSEGETKKFIKGIASLLVLAVIIAPLPTLLDSNFSLISDDTKQSGQTETNDDYLQRVYMERYKNYEFAIQNKIKAMGADEVTVRISIANKSGTIEVLAVNVDTSQMVLMPDKQNIDINRIIVDAVVSVLGSGAKDKIIIK